MRRITLSLVLFALALASALHAQSPGPGVPRLVPASGTLIDQAGKPLNGNNIKITFSVYADAGDQEPLWSETLKVQVTAGRYDALIGSSSPDGIPSSVFAAGEARWLGITADKAVAPPRSLLVSVPYAISSDDSSKLGGLPASAFVLKEDAGAAKSSSTPSGWKQAVDEEAAARADADTTLQNNVDQEAAERLQADTALQNNINSEAAARLEGDTSLQNSLEGAKSELHLKIDTNTSELHSKIDTTKGELNTKIDGTKSELTGKIDSSKAELNAKIDATKGALDMKIDATKSELTGKILFETGKVTNEQDAKLQALKNELQSDSTQKVTELDQKKTSKEEFEQEKTKKQLELDDIKTKKLEKLEFEQEKKAKQALIDELHQKKLARDEYLLDKQMKDLDIDDLKQKKLSKEEYLFEKLLKDAEILDLKQKKLEKLAFEAEKMAKDAAIKDLDDRIKDLTTQSGSLSEFVVTFYRDANRDAAGAVCAGSHVAAGIAIGLASDPAFTAAPQCVQVTGARMRADGTLIGMLSGFVAMPGLQHIPPAVELTGPTSHVLVGLNVEQNQMHGVCRRLFSNEPAIMTQASVAMIAPQQDRACAAGKSVIGLLMDGPTLDIVCR